MSDSPLTIPKLSKPNYKFKVPEGARQYPGDPKQSITIEAWSTGQELDALRVTSGRFEYEILQRALIKVDDKPVDQAESVIDGWSPRMRVLATDAINFVGMPEKTDRDDFLASVQISPG